jgi:hypothetical protein
VPSRQFEHVSPGTAADAVNDVAGGVSADQRAPFVRHAGMWLQERRDEEVARIGLCD